ncbi:unnamed protein product [Caenorhabditis angaria]|uniref:Uncharacterized protein n=1 Tax=Caenorhabditis angaria TaxID=860376 RepID=A0A9P1IF06_9PELO|nr:unnamed protein product [Caenorhabditis angaria]
MNSNVDLKLGFKIGLIIVGVVHLLLGLTVVIQAIGENILLDDVLDEQDKISFTRTKKIEKEATIIPAVFMPFIVGTVCLISVCAKRYFIFFVIIGANILELILFIVALVRSHQVYGGLSDHFDMWRKADKNKTMLSIEKNLYECHWNQV